ncbi:MAG: hypothetical protein OEW87_12715, partial [Flavobacteriaceae bacterium]|nr:hypothetical protein [Flavobacteriaceae bacterium]
MFTKFKRLLKRPVIIALFIFLLIISFRWLFTIPLSKSPYDGHYITIQQTEIQLVALPGHGQNGEISKLKNWWGGTLLSYENDAFYEGRSIVNALWYRDSVEIFLSTTIHNSTTTDKVTYNFKSSIVKNQEYTVSEANEHIFKFYNNMLEGTWSSSKDTIIIDSNEVEIQYDGENKRYPL